MKKSVGIFAVCLVLFGYFSYDVKKDIRSLSGLAFSEGDKIENFTLQQLDQSTVSLDSVISNNKYVWVNFWATWCGPCRREMPMMSKVYKAYKDDGFSIVAVNVGEDSVTVKNYLDNNPVPFTIVLDQDERVSEAYNVEALPTSFLIDSTGSVQRSGVGIQSSWEFFIERQLEGEN